MSKAPKTVFVCEQCGSESPKWLGRCPDCGEWNSFAEERAQENGGAPPSSHRYALAGARGAATLYADVRVEQHARLTTGIDEFVRVLGGGIVPGSLVLLGGASRDRTGRSSTAPARSRSIRSNRAANGSASAGRRCTCSPRRVWSGFSKRLRVSNRRW
ncbi:MAG: hypothetical protein DMG00_13045 [Acidobacteria bacterium]|nr:MAG: hypothetical protein DMG00_13045 [Acidobacteriota bacterium]